MATIIYRTEMMNRKKSDSRFLKQQQLRFKIQSALPHVTITSVEYVNNKYMHAAFQLRKVEYQRRNGLHCTIEELFHATASKNVSSILKSNLDWRRVTRSKYGKGVSFSDDPNYANKYCNNQNGNQRAFIVCDVLIGTCMQVRDNHDCYPKQNVDSYRSKSNRVVVKFDDFTFCPTYVVRYTNGIHIPSRLLRVSHVHDDYDDDYDIYDLIDDFTHFTF